MDNAVGMCVLERSGDRCCDMHGVRDGQLLLAQQQRAERFPLNKGHDVVRQAAGFPTVKQRQQVWVL